ncbi:MAG TPA: hypothetical protein VF637_11040 [Sphingomicrobium sp.]
MILGFALAIIAGLVLRKLMGFMAVEFVMRPMMLRARGVATILGWVAC